MKPSPRVVVAGAGVLGLTVALTLAEAGARVEVFDPAPLGDNASGVAAGMLAPVFESVLDPLSTPHFDLLSAARDLWPGLAARAGIALARDGALAVGSEAWLGGVAGALGALGVRAQAVTGEALRIAAPGLDRRFGRGLWTGFDWRIEPRPALVALRTAALGAGVVFHAASAGGDEACDWLVVATGAAPGLLERAPELCVLTPIKGHILRLAGELRVVVRGEEVYVAPAAGGMAVGATMEAGLDDRRVDPIQAARLVAQARSLFPGFSGRQAITETGVRAATPDGLPLAGASQSPGVLVAAGARRNGWLLAPLIAETLAALIFDQAPGPHAARLDPRRFSFPG